MLLIRRLSNEARLFQSFQAVGKNVGGNAFGRILQLSIGHITPEQVPNHNQRPLVADPALRRRPCASLALHLFQVEQGTSTPELSNMFGTPKKWPSRCGWAWIPLESLLQTAVVKFGS
jgi:hypothetical protein